MPVIRRTCGDLLVCFFHLHARLWVRSAHPAFPAPSDVEGKRDARPGPFAPRDQIRANKINHRHSGSRDSDCPESISPGIDAARWIPGLRRSAHPGMTTTLLFEI